MDNFLEKIDDKKDYFYNSLLGFFGFGIFIVFIGVVGIPVYLCGLTKLSRMLMCISWMCSALTMILCLVIGIFLNIGGEILIDTCRVMKMSLNNETEFNNTISHRIN